MDHEQKAFVCPHCGEKVKIRPGFPGRNAYVCKGCFNTVRLPKAN